MAGIDGNDLQSKLNKARAGLSRYKKHLMANPHMSAQLEPILQGYQELISDLEREFQRRQTKENKR